MGHQPLSVEGRDGCGKTLATQSVWLGVLVVFVVVGFFFSYAAWKCSLCNTVSFVYFVLGFE